MSNMILSDDKKSPTNIPLHAQRIRQARQAKELTLEEVSQHVSINKMTLLRYETGDIHTIAPERLYRLAELYDATPAYLCGMSPSQEFTDAQGLQITPISADLPSRLGSRLNTCLRFLQEYDTDTSFPR